MTNPLLKARARLANATRFGDAQRIAEARADFHREKLRLALGEHGQHLTLTERRLVDHLLDGLLMRVDL